MRTVAKRSRSAAFSTAAASSPTDSISLALSTDGSARSTSSGRESFGSGSQESTSTQMSEQLTFDLPGSTSSPAGSLARARARLANVRGLAIPRLRFGKKCSEPFAILNLVSYSWRTLQTSSLSTEERSSERFSQTWPRSGTTRSGTAFLLPPSAPLTAVTASSSPLLPTPMSRASSGTQVSGARRTGGLMLEETLKLLPTPTSVDHKRSRNYRDDGTKYSEKRHAGMTLTDALILLPTPQANDGLRYRIRWQSEGRSRGLEQTVVDLSLGATTKGRSKPGKYSSVDERLNPLFVEWMMGAPEGWSDPGCPLSATEFSSRPGGSADDGS